MGKNQHIVKHTDGWAVKSAGASKASSVHQTQAAAIKQGTAVAQNQKSEILIHGQNGQIRERNSFGNDPHPPKG